MPAKVFPYTTASIFARLLGDMRSYNYVIRMTPDFDDRQYRVRAIDFDQQSHEGRHRFYLPQFFKDNREVVELCLNHLEPDSIDQYREEELSLMQRRASASPHRLAQLRRCMVADTISEPEKTEELARELARFHEDPSFRDCMNMGELTFRHIEHMLRNVGGLRLADGGINASF